ncbi:MAG: hypothetical protein KDC76_08715 [Bacteroidetes bacterium]|nr:hypothetical protein [Bacteroidota bacterium]
MKKLILISFAVLTALQIQAQDSKEKGQNVQIEIPDVAIMDLEATNGKSIVLNVNAPTEAGLPVDFSDARDSSLWLNYSSVCGKGKSSKRKVQAKITSGSLPSYMRLVVEATNDAGYGDGDVGVPNNRKFLSTHDQTIVKNIETCYTGDGVGKGHQLIYSLELKNNKYDEIDFDDATTLTILYTISND